jgi:hypothetical protein
MSKEGSTVANPIRFRNRDAVLIYEKGKKAFQNQIPNTYVIDSKSHTYVCTTSKSAKGEPIWAFINDTTLEPAGKFILVNTGDSGTEAITRGTGGKKVTYSLPTLIARDKRGSYNKTSFGSFIFVRLSSAETVLVSTPPAGTPAVTTTTTSNTDVAEAVSSAYRHNRDIYFYMREQSNGRSGSGAPANTTPAQINRTDANGNSGFGAGGQVVPAPSGSSNPSSPSAGGPKRNKSGAAASTPENRADSPNRKTVEVTFSPDKNIYNGLATYNGYQDKPYIQQTITNFNSAKMTRERIIRRHIFDIIPNSFEFSQLSSQWNDIERSGNYPMVDWAKYNLTKCSFRFLVAGRRKDTFQGADSIVNDGMDVPIDSELENIRAIAGSPSPVILYNLNDLLTKSYRFPYINNTRNIQWVIADLSITATRLTPNGRGIAAAEVSITLNEYPIIGRDIVPLPPLVPENPTTKQCKPTSKNNFCKPKTTQDGLYLDDYQWKPDGQLGWQQGQP